MSKIDFVVDIETLGIQDNSVVCTIAICWFDWKEIVTPDELYKRTKFIKFDINEQMHLGRHIEEDTAQWWRTLPEEVRRKSLIRSDTDISVIEGLNELNDYIKSNGYAWKYNDPNNSFMWARGMDFDAKHLYSLYNLTKTKPSWNVFGFRDIRTYFDILLGTCGVQYPLSDEIKNKFKKHDPEADVVLDIISMMDLHKKLYEK